MWHLHSGGRASTRTRDQFSYDHGAQLVRVSERLQPTFDALQRHAYAHAHAACTQLHACRMHASCSLAALQASDAAMMALPANTSPASCAPCWPMLLPGPQAVCDAPLLPEQGRLPCGRGAWAPWTRHQASSAPMWMKRPPSAALGARSCTWACPAWLRCATT